MFRFTLKIVSPYRLVTGRLSPHLHIQAVTLMTLADNAVNGCSILLSNTWVSLLKHLTNSRHLNHLR